MYLSLIPETSSTQRTNLYFSAGEYILLFTSNNEELLDNTNLYVIQVNIKISVSDKNSSHTIVTYIFRRYVQLIYLMT